MNEFNPYAPPEAEVGAGARTAKKKTKAKSGAIVTAIERLNEHLADPNAVAFDRKQAGGKLRTVTVVFVAITVVVIGILGYVTTTMNGSGAEAAMMATGLVAFIFGLLAIILLVVDLRMVPRDQPASPEATLKHFFKAIALGRLGYAWAALCPTAREQTVETPALGQIPVGAGSFTLRSTEDFKRYTQTFARPGSGQMRTMQVKQATLLSENGDVADVELTVQFQAWPQWAQVLGVLGFVFVRLLGVVIFLVLFFALRKTHNVMVRKTLIRGSNGVWYVYSGDILESAQRES